jgi:hypothetical protein
MNGHQDNACLRFWPAPPKKTFSIKFFPYPELLEKIAKEIYVFHAEWYDSPTEIPHYTLAKTAAEFVGNARVPINEVEISPYFGAIHVTWKDRECGRKVMGIFGPESNKASLYWEERVDNHETHDVKANPSSADLHEKVLWCCDAPVECAM